MQSSKWKDGQHNHCVKVTVIDKSPLDLVILIDARVKLIGRDYFPLQFFLDLSIWGCNLDSAFKVQMSRKCGVQPACECSVFH